MGKLIVLLLLLGIGSRADAQESAQLRGIVHSRFFVSGEAKPKPNGMFLVGWSITNVMSGIPNNSNVLLGFGYAGKSWAIENMIQRQWSSSGNALLLDWRFTAQPTKRISIYVEGAPRIDNRILFYDFVTVDVQVLGPFNIGIETENVHRYVGKDTLGLGPRVVFPLPSFGFFKPTVIASRQLRTLGPNVTRLYTIFNCTF